MTELYRLVYASKNLLEGSEKEMAAVVEQILAASQRNNTAADVTGALMFNGRAFAQVLEGPRLSVEETFERIQCDPRHSDVTVLQCGPAESRSFGNWSMAFVGQSTQGQTLWNGMAADTGFDLSRLDGDAVFAMLHSLVLEEEGVPAAISNLPPGPAVDHPPAALPVEQIRAELAHLRPALVAGDPAPAIAVEAPAARSVVSAGSSLGEAAETAFGVLKAALASERQRTTELRNAMDELQIALASSHDQLQAMRDERNLWAERSRLLAKALGDKAEEVRQGSQADMQVGHGQGQRPAARAKSAA